MEPQVEAASPFADRQFVERTASRLVVAWQLSGMSFEELSRRSQISRSALSRYLKGTRMPNALALSRLCSVLGTSADWVLAVRPSGGEKILVADR